MVGDNLLSFWRPSFFSAIFTADLYSLVPQHQAPLACGSCAQRINSSIEKLLNACHIHRRHKSSDHSKSLPFQEQASPRASFFHACLLAWDSLGYFLQKFPDWGISNKSWSRVWDCLFFPPPLCVADIDGGSSSSNSWRKHGIRDDKKCIGSGGGDYGCC